MQKLSRKSWNMTVTAAMLGAIIIPMAASTLAQASTDFEYPELAVTPRASERLDAEASREPGRRWTEYLPIQVSAVSTLAAGILLSGDSVKDTTKGYNAVGMAIGGGWLATTLAIEAFYQPYSSAKQEVNAMPHKTQREQLTRERYAEEVFRSQARLATRLKWLSVATNLGANVLMITNGQSGSTAQVFAATGAVLSLTPLVFRSYRQDIADEQEDYKKRIYGPVASATIFSAPGTHEAAPGVVLSMSF